MQGRGNPAMHDIEWRAYTLLQVDGTSVRCLRARSRAHESANLLQLYCTFAFSPHRRLEALLPEQLAC